VTLVVEIVVGMVWLTYLTCGDTQLTCFRVDDTGCGNHYVGWSVDMSNMSVDMSNMFYMWLLLLSKSL